MFSVRRGELGMSVRWGQGEHRSMFFKIPPQAAISWRGRAALRLFYTFMVVMLFSYELFLTCYY